ncbi:MULTISPECIES: hypothetical protein [Pseudoalteromonas]|uniref:hypothetical protein n=1 Tax=Pseudoalteromonas TaxID=53246 RepID=UPI0030035718
MFKWLDKYMDNLKSPYWEVYFWIFVIAIGIAGTVIIFIDPKGLASKFGNAGSFLGALFTIAALIVAVIGYKANKRENSNRLGLEAQAALLFEILPKLIEGIEKEAMRLRGNIAKAKDNDWKLDQSEEFIIIQKRNQLDELKKNLMIKVNYLKHFTEVENKNDESFIALLNFINEIMKISEYLTAQPIISNEQEFNIRKIKIEHYMLNSVFYIKYFKRSVDGMLSLTTAEDAYDMRNQLEELEKNFKHYIALQAN